MKQPKLTYSRIVKLPQPLGKVLISATDEGVVEVRLNPVPQEFPRVQGKAKQVIDEAIQSLKNYARSGVLAGAPKLALEGTPFQKKVWNKLQRVKAGKTMSYGDLAEAAGFPGASRAVGSAMARNPVAIFVPCHRVVQAGGKIGNYGGGGVHVKRALLEHEGARV